MRTRDLILLACSIGAALASCAPGTPRCPRSLAEAEGEGFSAIGEDTRIYAGYVIRYVPALDAPQARGYDLDIVRWIRGRPDPNGIFLRVDAPITGIDPGDPVLIIGEPGPRPIILESGPCQALTQIDEDEVERE